MKLNFISKILANFASDRKKCIDGEKESRHIIRFADGTAVGVVALCGSADKG